MKLPLPILIVNFKTYSQGVGVHAEELAFICERVAEKTGKNIAIAVSPADIYRISRIVQIPVLSQHMDSDEFGTHTGKIIAEDIKDNGAIGTLLNHSEDQYRMDVLDKAIDRCREVGLLSVVCANNEDIAESVAALHPDLIAVEPPELIASETSVSSAKPEVITNTVQRVHRVADIPVLCGAGVKSKEDVAVALALGSQGILLSSHVVKAKDPEAVLYELVSAFI